MIGTLQATLTRDRIEILKAVLYFDVFKYPLTRNELFENSAILISRDFFDKEVDFLISQSFIQEINGFIIHTDRTGADIQRRLDGNRGAEEIKVTALLYSRKIASFPFVTGVGLSGALSKNYYDEDGDIDFFIITKQGRLWIARTLLILRYKLLSRNKKKFWCVNYFISESNLMIPDMNVFTATELAYLIPTVNYKAYQKLLLENPWYKTRFPNKKLRSATDCIDEPSTLIKRSFEFIFGGWFGSIIDSFLLRITLKHWRKKYPVLNEEDFELQFRSRKDVCKRHTFGYQNKIILHWEEKIRSFEARHNVSMSEET